MDVVVLVVNNNVDVDGGVQNKVAVGILYFLVKCRFGAGWIVFEYIVSGS